MGSTLYSQREFAPNGTDSFFLELTPAEKGFKNSIGSLGSSFDSISSSPDKKG